MDVGSSAGEDWFLTMEVPSNEATLSKRRKVGGDSLDTGGPLGPSKLAPAFVSLPASLPASQKGMDASSEEAVRGGCDPSIANSLRTIAQTLGEIMEILRELKRRSCLEVPHRVKCPRDIEADKRKVTYIGALGVPS